MKEPTVLELRCYEFGDAVAIRVENRQTGDDTETVYLVLTNDIDETLELAKYDFAKNYWLSLTGNAVAILRANVSDDCEAWRGFLKKENQEYKEFMRLKEKFESKIESTRGKKI